MQVPRAAQTLARFIRKNVSNVVGLQMKMKKTELAAALGISRQQVWRDLRDGYYRADEDGLVDIDEARTGRRNRSGWCGGRRDGGIAASDFESRLRRLFDAADELDEANDKNNTKAEHRAGAAFDGIIEAMQEAQDLDVSVRLPATAALVEACGVLIGLMASVDRAWRSFETLTERARTECGM